MTSIGSLQVDLGLDSSEFTSGLNDAVKSLGDSVSGMQGSLSSMQGAVEGLSTLIGAGALGAAIAIGVKAFSDLSNAGLDTTKTIQDAADKLQLTTAEYQTAIQGLPAAIQIPADVFEGYERLRSSIEQVDAAIKNGFATGFIAAFATELDVSNASLVTLNSTAAEFGIIIGKLATLTIDSASAFKDLNNSLPNMASDTGKELDQIGDGITNLVNKAAAFGYSIYGMNNMPDYLPGIAKNITEITADVGTGLSGAFQKVLDDVGNLNGQLQNLQKANEASAGPANPLLKELTDDTEAMEAFRHAQVEFTQAGLIDSEAWKQRATLIKDAMSPLETYETQIQKITILQQAMGLTAEQAFNLQVKAAATLADEWATVASTAGAALTSLFKNNKDVAIANAVISTAGGIAKSLETYGATPLGYAAMAAAALAGAAQIATIESTSPGSGSGSSAAASTSATSATATTPAGPQQAVSINLVGGNNFTRTQVEGLVANLKQYQTDGGTLLIK